MHQHGTCSLPLSFHLAMPEWFRLQTALFTVMRLHFQPILVLLSSVKKKESYRVFVFKKRTAL
jgi:hypothetical protein